MAGSQGPIRTDANGVGPERTLPRREQGEGRPPRFGDPVPCMALGGLSQPVTVIRPELAHHRREGSRRRMMTAMQAVTRPAADGGQAEATPPYMALHTIGRAERVRSGEFRYR